MLNYSTFKIPKRSGGTRIIDAPSDELKEIQRGILEKLYKSVKVSPFCHGGIPDRNIATNALNHVGRYYIASCDIKNFFPSITLNNFKLNCYDKMDEDLFNEVIEYCFYKNRLPQGGVTSPYLANIFLSSFDWKMANIFAKRGIFYSRYFDDITLSVNEPYEHKSAISTMLWISLLFIVKNSLTRLGLTLNSNKIKIIGKGSRQEVCGVTVNEKLNVNKRYRLSLRSEIYHQKNNAKLSKETSGKIAFVNSIRNNDKSYKNSIEFVIEKASNDIKICNTINDKTRKEKIIQFLISIKNSLSKYKNNEYLIKEIEEILS